MPKKTASKKKYIPSSKEKYMCTKHKKFFTAELIKWKKDIIKANNLGNLLNSSDDSVSSADIVDQASSYTDKSVEMKALNRSRKLISKINSALQRIKEGVYGYCVETGEPIAFSLFNTQREQPFVLAMGLHESDNIEYLRDENFLEVVKIFEEYACGGLEYLEGKLDQAHIKEEIEGMLAEACNDDFLGNIANEWSQN